MKKKKENTPPQADGDGNITHIGMSLSQHEFDQINNHVKLLNCGNQNDPQQNSEWVLSAIRAKLERESDFNVRFLPEKKHLSLYMDANLHAKLDERIDHIKKLTGGYTKKQWILAAVGEQLSREEQEATELLKKLRTQGQKKTTSNTSG